MKKEYITLIVIGAILLCVGYFWFVLPFILSIAVTILVFAVIKEKFIATIVSFLSLTYIGSIFSLLIFYCEPSRTITQLDAAMSILTWVTATNYIDLLINLWMATEGPGLQWIIFSIGTATILLIVVLLILRNRPD